MKITLPPVPETLIWVARFATLPQGATLLKRDVTLFSIWYAILSDVLTGDVLADLRKKVEWRINSLAMTENIIDLGRSLQSSIGKPLSGDVIQRIIEGHLLHENYAKIIEQIHPAVSLLEKRQDVLSGTITRNIGILSSWLSLSATEENLFRWSVALHLDGPVAAFWISLARHVHHMDLLAAMIGISTRALQQATGSSGTVFAISLLQRGIHSNDFSVHDYLIQALSEPTPVRLLARFQRRHLPDRGVLGEWHPDDKVLFETLLDFPESFHALVHAPGEIDLPTLLRKSMKSSWTVRYIHDDVPEVLWPMVLRLVPPDTEAKRTLLVVRNAERLLGKQQSEWMALFGLEDANADTKTWRNWMKKTPGSILWWVNRSRGLRPEFLEQAAACFNIRPAPRKVRRRIVEKVVEGLAISDAGRRTLSQYEHLSVPQLRQADRLVRAIPGLSNEDHERLLLHTLAQSHRLAARDKKELLRMPITKYSLELLHTSGVFKPGQIIEALRAMPNATLCFYGLPGTGKTQLVEHMALELDQPLMIRRASDLLDKFVGETEKRIAGMFAEAEQEGAILFLDEADSFLRDRSLARENWHVTQVNELLQHMERFPGIFVCATNLVSHLDIAALRRFTFKLEFLSLTSEQRWLMFKNEALDGLDWSSTEEDQWREDLDLLPLLTAGDFSTVKRQAKLLRQSLSPSMWISQLRMETDAKRIDRQRMDPDTERNRH